MQWLVVAFALVIVATFAMTLVGAFRASRRGWVMNAIRLRYVAFGLLLVVIGLRFTVDGVARWIDWGSLLVGLFALAMGGAYLYARGGIGVEQHWRGSSHDPSTPHGASRPGEQPRTRVDR